jgi:hypothetical protein
MMRLLIILTLESSMMRLLIWIGLFDWIPPRGFGSVLDWTSNEYLSIDFHGTLIGLLGPRKFRC